MKERQTYLDRPGRNKSIGRLCALLLLLWIAIGGQYHAKAQTCCSGGVPISGNLGLPTASSGTWQFSLNYDANVLKTLKDERDILDDLTRERQTNTIIFEVGYTLTERISFDVFTSYVRQERILRPIGFDKNEVFTNGFGDAVLLGKYKVIDPLQVGIGVKMPTGATDLTFDGIPLNADLQPGSGAWDAIFWSNYTNTLGFRQSLTFSGTAIYRATGKNDDYLGRQTYEFGNEWQLIAGLADRFLIGAVMIDPSIRFRYRKAGEDINSDFKLPNTGGEWVFINPGVSIPLKPSLSWQINAEVPLYSKVYGTQLTPTYRLNTGFYWNIKPKSNESIIQL